MRRIGIAGVLVVIGVGMALGLARHGIMPGGIGDFDDIDWYGA